MREKFPSACKTWSKGYSNKKWTIISPAADEAKTEGTNQGSHSRFTRNREIKGVLKGWLQTGLMREWKWFDEWAAVVELPTNTSIGETFFRLSHLHPPAISLWLTKRKLLDLVHAIDCHGLEAALSTISDRIYLHWKKHILPPEDHHRQKRSPAGRCSFLFSLIYQ